MQNAKQGEGARELREGKARFKPYGLNVSEKSRFKAPLSAFLPRDGVCTAERANGDSEAILWRFRGRPSALGLWYPPSDRALSSPNRSTE